MTIKEHVEILRQGVKAWDRWRAENRGVRPNLRGAYLTGAHLIGAHLIGTDLTGAILNSAILSRADLSRAILSGADLSRAEGLTPDQIDSAHGNPATQLPDGLARPDHWDTD